MSANLSVPFTRVTVSCKFTTRVVGGVPADPKLIAGWLKANMPEVAEAELEKLAATTLAEVGKVVEDESKPMWTTFKRDENGIYMEGRQLKAAFKECANILRDVFQKQETAERKGTAKATGEGEGKAQKSRFTALKAKLAERLFVEEERVYLRTETQAVLKEPHGNEENPIHVMTAQGPRTALKKFDFCEPGTHISFTVRWLNDGVVDASLVRALLEYMQWNGIGASRSQGNGQFTFEIGEL